MTNSIRLYSISNVNHFACPNYLAQENFKRKFDKRSHLFSDVPDLNTKNYFDRQAASKCNNIRFCQTFCRLLRLTVNGISIVEVGLCVSAIYLYFKISHFVIMCKMNQYLYSVNIFHVVYQFYFRVIFYNNGRKDSTQWRNYSIRISINYNNSRNYE